MSKTVYMAFGTDIIHHGHIDIMNKAASLGELTVGVLSDEVMLHWKHPTLLTLEERSSIFREIKCVSRVVVQNTGYYEENLRKYRPDYVVHGDDWASGNLKPIRENVIKVLGEIGGELIEYPYTKGIDLDIIRNELGKKASLPEIRRARLSKLLKSKSLLRIMEAHNGITGLIVEKAQVHKENKTESFDGIWVSSLCDSTAKGKPDIELVDLTSRLQTINDIMEVTSKPIILDADTGGLTEHFEFNVKTLERIGVSAVIIEDKTGLKKNSLFGNEVDQSQDSIDNFCEKISRGVKSLNSEDFLVIARIESLILDKGMDDAIMRAKAYIEAGARGIMIHSRKKQPDEIFEFCRIYKEFGEGIPLVVVPTSFNAVTEAEFENHGVNIVIYANHLIRSAFPAMMKTARSILENNRSLEADEYCLSISEILNLIPGGK